MTLANTLTRSLSSVRRHAVDVGNVVGGIYRYYRRGDASTDARASLLALHCRTNGQFTDWLATLLRMLRPPRTSAPATGLLGDMSVADQRRIVDAIARDGFHVFESRLPPALCDEIAAFACTAPCSIEGRANVRDQLVTFNADAPASKTYRVPETDIVTCHAMQQLMADQAFIAIAETYLKTHPMLSMVNLWWSVAYGDKPGGDAAQEFHFDFDPPPVWLLFFVYLTDVGPQNGPHVYVRGSHLAGTPTAGPLRARGYVRIPDDDIAAAFGPENIVELHGKRGTVLAVDTRGFHKGKMLTSGQRLMAQLTFSCPPFSGAHGRRQVLPPDIDPALVAAVAAAPRVYERYR